MPSITGYFLNISIHALLAESDPIDVLSVSALPISIHALLAESDLILGFFGLSAGRISIHALLAESDAGNGERPKPVHGFLSTLSLRRATLSLHHADVAALISIHALLAESDSTL